MCFKKIYSQKCGKFCFQNVEKDNPTKDSKIEKSHLKRSVLFEKITYIVFDIMIKFLSNQIVVLYKY